MMNSDDVKAMRRAGMQIGAHTTSHPILAVLDDGDAHAEIESSRRFLEKLLDERVGLFAYPNVKPVDDYTPRNVEMVRELGFDAAVSTQGGTTSCGDDLFQIRRFTPWDSGKTRFGARMLANLRGFR
jgi:peptidoglycan/xylan/chitin deacetylase (PgdA/CDA1 family)